MTWSLSACAPAIPCSSALGAGYDRLGCAGPRSSSSRWCSLRRCSLRRRRDARSSSRSTTFPWRPVSRTTRPETASRRRSRTLAKRPRPTRGGARFRRLATRPSRSARSTATARSSRRARRTRSSRPIRLRGIARTISSFAAQVRRQRAFGTVRPAARRCRRGSPINVTTARVAPTASTVVVIFEARRRRLTTSRWSAWTGAQYEDPSAERTSAPPSARETAGRSRRVVFREPRGRRLRSRPVAGHMPVIKVALAMRKWRRGRGPIERIS